MSLIFPFGLFIGTSLATYIIYLLNKKYSTLFVLSQMCLFVAIYTLSSEQAYSDRQQYLYWFNHVDSQLQEHHDVAFVMILKIISLFSSQEAWFYLCMALLLIFLIKVLADDVLNNKEKVIFYSMLIPNRFILDFSMNSIRTFYLEVFLLLLMYQVYYKKRYIYLLFFPVLFYVHKSIFILLILIILLSNLVNYRLVVILFFISLFFVLTTSGDNFISQWSRLYFSDFLNDYRYGGTDYVLENNNNSTLSIRAFIPMLIVFVIPITFLIRYYKSIGDADKITFKLMIFSCAIVFFTFLSIPIMFRILGFSIPILYLLISKYSYINYKFIVVYAFILLIYNYLAFIDNFKGSLLW